ncbi:hypothetical protein CAC42_6603 [Sphaceloma murrayae]|uniref:RUS1 family protein n=1 Tax=Sphaceloma murrayae TaxID=2082308 RepID=A0A2K1QGT0_9PEZI|nr:hypothetical protein CAC42_6603 [Sphaceloma murrayae]
MASTMMPRIVSTDEAGVVVATFVPSRMDKREAADGQEHVRIDVVRPPTSLSTHLTSLLSIFLPTGYPHSVTPDYTPYQIYDSLQAFTSTIASLLSSRAVLSTMGVGDSSATATLAILLSTLQDTLGRVATIVFAHRLGTALEPECKMYRLLADVFNDAAMVLELLSPAFGPYGRVGVLAFASALKALCGVAAGSSKASLSRHFARWGNLGELNAKDGSQETVIGLVGMGVGGWVVSRVGEGGETWVWLLGLLGVHLWCNWMAVRSVTMRTLNRQRAGLVMGEWIEGGTVLGPEEVRLRERVFERDGIVRDRMGNVLGWCRIGISFEDYLLQAGKGKRAGGHAFHVQQQVLNDVDNIDRGGQRGYLIHVDGRSRQCSIALGKRCEVRDQVKAWFTAYRALQLLQHGQVEDSHREGLVQAVTDGTDDDSSPMGLTNLSSSVEQAAQAYADEAFPELAKRLEEVGWDLDTGALETRRGSRFARMA